MEDVCAVNVKKQAAGHCVGLKLEAIEEEYKSAAAAELVADETADHALALELSGAPPPRPQPVPIGATLIVSPMTIVRQWAKEIEKHAPGLRVFEYKGRKSDMAPEDVARHVADTMEQFARHDIVLVTYSVMGHEVHYGQPVQHRLRTAKRYAVPTSPLLDCHWHRVILDEAQQVHSLSSVPFRMAARLSCSSRFCVSGTPIGPSGLHDLYGLVLFLKIAPFSDPDATASAWQRCMRAATPDGLERLRTLLRRIMWRHSMDHVQSECRLPPLHFSKVLLSFTRIEMENYLRLQNDEQAELQRSAGTLQDRSALRKLDSLRQACAHPQAVSLAFGSELKSLDNIGGWLVELARDKVTAAERDLCRAYNQLGVELWHQGKFAAAELEFKQSWLISDRGLHPEGNFHQQRAHHTRPKRDRARPQHPALVDGADEGGKKKKTATLPPLLNNFQSDVNIVTKNTQLREWRVIDLLITKRLAESYALQLRTLHGIEPEPGLAPPGETIKDSFQRIMQGTREMVPGVEDGQPVYMVLADKRSAKAAAALPPQLAAAAAAFRDGGGSSASSGASAAAAAASFVSKQEGLESSDAAPLAAVLLLNFHNLREQHEYILAELLDVFHNRVQDLAVLVHWVFETEDLPAAVANSVQSVKDMYALRARIGVDTFNSPRQPYMTQLRALWKRLKAEQRQANDILILYDLRRTMVELDEEQREHDIFARRQSRKGASAAAAAAVHTTAATSGAGSLAVAPSRPADRVQHDRKTVMKQVVAYEKRIGARTLERLRHECNVDCIDELLDSRKHWQRHNDEWTQLRDSTHALFIMEEVWRQSEKLRRHTTTHQDGQRVGVAAHFGG
jgi:hypothetical protein